MFSLKEFLELDELNFEKILQKSNTSGKSGVAVHNVTCNWSQVRVLNLYFVKYVRFHFHQVMYIYLTSS